jgi:hypothetical protein
MTKFRAGLVLGLATGYWFGTKAGRERHEQLQRLGGLLRRNPAVDQAATAVGRAKAVVDLSRFRVHDAVEHADAALGTVATAASALLG